MLKTISCDKFFENGLIRKPIQFNMGLNCILGNDAASNSIGKSTLLMIIDFCFGGNDYVFKEKDTIQHIGEHEIKFEFIFNGVSKYFKRATNSYTFIDICDKNYNIINRITLENFRLGLLKYYGLEKYGMSFRDWISPFFRIYNRKTHNELRPINAHVRETDGDGIVNLLRMFNKYDEIEELNNHYKEKKELKKQYDNLKRFKIAPIASNEKEYYQMKRDLESYEKELLQLDTDNKTNTNDSSVIEMERKKELKKEKGKLRKQKIALEEQLNSIEVDSDYDEQAFARQYKSLTKFFPNVNLKTIIELEKFHKEVTGFIKNDINETNENILNMISIIDGQIKKIDEELLNYKQVPNVSDSYIERRHQLIDLINNLKSSIVNYEQQQIANNEFEKCKENLEMGVQQNLSFVEIFLNGKMKDYNNSIRQAKKKYTPLFNFNTLASYSFYTPNDTGTGTRYKAVCLLDLAIIDGTPLPSFCHDSIMFTNIEDETARDLLKIYATKNNKQIFVAVEKPSRYNEVLDNGKVYNIALANKVIQLFEDERALFGFQWNKD